MLGKHKQDGCEDHASIIEDMDFVIPYNFDYHYEFDHDVFSKHPLIKLLLARGTKLTM